MCAAAGTPVAPASPGTMNYYSRQPEATISTAAATLVACEQCGEHDGVADGDQVSEDGGTTVGWRG